MFTTRTAVEQSIPRFESHKLIAKSNVESITNQPIAFTQIKGDEDRGVRPLHNGWDGGGCQNHHHDHN